MVKMTLTNFSPNSKLKALLRAFAIAGYKKIHPHQVENTGEWRFYLHKSHENVGVSTLLLNSEGKVLSSVRGGR